MTAVLTAPAPTGPSPQCASVAEQIAANEAWLAAAVADNTTDPIDYVTVAAVIEEDGGSITVPRDLVEVEHFTTCDVCEAWFLPNVSGNRNCYGYFCENDERANACHRECYA